MLKLSKLLLFLWENDGWRYIPPITLLLLKLPPHCTPVAAAPAASSDARSAPPRRQAQADGNRPRTQLRIFSFFFFFENLITLISHRINLIGPQFITKFIATRLGKCPSSLLHRRGQTQNGKRPRLLLLLAWLVAALVSGSQAPRLPQQRPRL